MTSRNELFHFHRNEGVLECDKEILERKKSDVEMLEVDDPWHSTTEAKLNFYNQDVDKDFGKDKDVSMEWSDCDEQNSECDKRAEFEVIYFNYFFFSQGVVFPVVGAKFK